MIIKTLGDSDVQILIDIAIDTFQPFYEGYVRDLLGETVFQHQHGHWREGYATDIPTLDDPKSGRHVAIAEIDEAIIGFVSWKIGVKPNHGEIHLLAVSEPCRREHVGRELCLYAMAEMKRSGIDVVEIGTGGDAFHLPARSLYESLGFTPIPVVAYLKKI